RSSSAALAPGTHYSLFIFHFSLASSLVYTIKNATVHDIPLIRELCLKVWPQTYAPILSQDRINYMLEYMYSPASLEKQINGGSQFIFVYENEAPVGFAAYLLKGHGIYKLDK